MQVNGTHLREDEALDSRLRRLKEHEELLRLGGGAEGVVTGLRLPREDLVLVRRAFAGWARPDEGGAVQREVVHRARAFSIDVLLDTVEGCT